MVPALLGAPEFCVAVAGRKAATLHELALAGHAVPPGFVLAPETDLCAVDDRTLDAWVASCGGYPVAVRSSGVVEDLDDASFAGLYESYLDVRDAATLRRRIAECRSSARGARVAAYAAQHQLDPDVALSVLVQKQIPARCSGVGFSLDPITGIEEHALIEWCAGAGDKLVSGAVTPARARVRLADGGVVDQPAGPDAALVTEGQLGELALLLRSIQALRHRPQDVEWALDHHGRIWVLQARAITAIRWRTDGPLLTDADFREGGVSARVCTPLMFSLYRNAFEPTMQAFWQQLRLLDAGTRPEWIMMRYGRVYWNVDAVKDRYAGLPGYDERTFDTDLGIHRDYTATGGPRRTPVSPGTLLRALPAAVALARAQRRQLADAEAFIRGWSETYQTWRQRVAGVRHMTDRVFAATLRECLLALHLMTEQMYFTTIYVSTSVQSDAKRLLRRVDDAVGGATAVTELMGGLTNLSHLALQSAVVDLHRIAGTAGLGSDAWQHALTAFLAAHGHHADAELDLLCPRWSEQPDRVRDLIGDMLATGIAPADPAAVHAAGRRRFRNQRAALHRRLRARPWAWLRFGAAVRRQLPRMRRYLVAREEMREISMQCYALVRACVLEAGRRLAAGATLARPQDVFMLTAEEIVALVGHDLKADAVAARILLRQSMFDGHRDLTPPHELGGGLAHTRQEVPRPGSTEVRGIGCSPGVVEGTVRTISALRDIHQLTAGDVLVTRFTDPGWTPALGLVAGVVTEVGGLLSHAAVISREYGIPAVLNAEGATQTLRSGQRVRVDGDAGVVSVLSAAPAEVRGG